MRIIITLITTFFVGFSSLFGQVFINEISYKDANTADRGVEVAGPANTDLDNWYLEFYNNLGGLYHTETINGTLLIDSESLGRGGIWIPIGSLQNQDDRTIILYDNNNAPIDTISYGSNPFAAYASKNIGIVQDFGQVANGTPQNPNENNNDGTWNLEPETKGNLNDTQLPVELMTFEVFVLDNQIDLMWKTATEINNSHFEIQRSTDGIEYETIGIINGNGSTLETQSYEFTDNIPVKGYNYYRLKQVDLDGQFSYSDIVSVNIETEISVTIAPNPIRTNQDIQIITTNNAMVDIMIYDMTGRVVRQYYSTNSINVDNLQRGMYIYKIWLNQELITTDRFMVID